jgi:ribosome biogenesis protein MAK21
MAGPHGAKPKHGGKRPEYNNNNSNKHGGNNNNYNSSNNNSSSKEPISEVKKAFASVVKGPSASGSIPKNMLSNVKAKPAKVKLVFKPTPQWYNNELPELEDDGKDHHMLETTLAQKTTQAQRLLEEENTRYDENPNLSSSDKNFVSTIMSSGTLNDRVSALTLLVQESPLHTTKSLEKLMAMAEKKSRTESVKSIESLKDLFIGGMLPDRKLK